MENKNYIWRPVSEYTGGRVLATNGLDVLIGEINSEGDCESEEGGSTILCGITGFIKIEEMFPELKESEKRMIQYFKDLAPFDKADELYEKYGFSHRAAIAWLEKRGENSQNPYSGVSFVYNGHTWGMCARDNGVEILVDGHIKGRVFTNDSNAKEMFIKALERVEEQNSKGYKLTDCDKNSWWEDFKAYTSCIIEQKPADEELKKLLRAEYEKGRAKGKAQTLCEMPKEIDSQVWKIANNAAITWEQSFAILMAAKNAYDKGKADAIVQTPSWSEEDERLCQCLIEGQEEALDKVSNDKYGHSEIISDLKEMYRERIDWLKSLKDRVQPKQEWSEEDKA